MYIEATSALDLVAEQAMYELLQSSDLSFISVGHRPSLLKYHDQVLVLGNKGQLPKLKDIGEMDQNALTEEFPKER